jgi:hypothetical protein
MDTAVRSWDTRRRQDPTADIFTKRIEGDQLVGEGIVNDKGHFSLPMAAKAVKATGIPLKGVCS